MTARYAFKFFLEIDSLRNRVKQLEEEKTSLINTMVGYSSITQDRVLHELESLMVLTQMKIRWEEKSARIERFRPSERKNGNTAGYANNFSSIEAIINLGSRDKVKGGMTFMVHDSVDGREFGTIEIMRSFDEGSICKITRPINPDFWEGIVTSLAGSPHGLPAPPNRIILETALGDIKDSDVESLEKWLHSATSKRGA